MKAAHFPQLVNRLFHTLVIVLVFATLLPWRALAADGRLRFSPEAIQLLPGEEVTIEVWMDDVDGLYGLDLRISYDPSVVEILDDNSGIDGVQVSGGAFPYPDFEVKNEVSVDDRQIWYAVTQLNPRDPVSGSGIVLTLRARALAEGVCYLDVAYAKYVNRDGIELEITYASGEIRVVTSANSTIAPPPTRTHTPTATHTATATPSMTPTPTSEGVIPLATLTAAPTATPVPSSTTRPSATSSLIGPAPTLTKTPDGAYLAPSATAQQQPTRVSNGSGGYESPNATVVPQPATRSPLPTLTISGSGAGYPEPTPPGQLQPTATVMVPGGTAPTVDPFAAPMIVAAATAVAPQQGSAKVAMVMPTLEKVWPQQQPMQDETDPLIPREMFICLSSGLVLATVLVAVYLWRRDKIQAHQA